MIITIRIEVENGTVTAVETEKEIPAVEETEAVYTGEDSFGSNLKRIRKEKGFTQEELSEQLGLASSSTITNWEKGIRNPSVIMVPKIAKVLDCSINELYEEKKTSREREA